MKDTTKLRLIRELSDTRSSREFLRLVDVLQRSELAPAKFLDEATVCAFGQFLRNPLDDGNPLQQEFRRAGLNSVLAKYVVCRLADPFGIADRFKALFLLVLRSALEVFLCRKQDDEVGELRAVR